MLELQPLSSRPVPSNAPLTPISPHLPPLAAVTDRLECAVVGPSLAERVPPIASVQRTGKGADGADAAAAAAVGVAPEAAGAFDVLVANILLGPLLSLEPRLTACVCCAEMASTAFFPSSFSLPLKPRRLPALVSAARVIVLVCVAAVIPV